MSNSLQIQIFYFSSPCVLENIEEKKKLYNCKPRIDQDRQGAKGNGPVPPQRQRVGERTQHPNPRRATSPDMSSIDYSDIRPGSHRNTVPTRSTQNRNTGGAFRFLGRTSKK